MSWATIRDGMKTRLSTISGLVPYDVQPDTMPNKDVAVVLPGDPVLESTGHGKKTLVNIIVRVRCSRATSKDSSDALDAYIWPSGGNSIPSAVDGGPTLSGTVDDVRWSRTENYGSEVQGVHQADLLFQAMVSA